MTTAPRPGRYARLDFNAPMSTELANELAVRLTSRDPASVVDVGCGWAELLLRVLARALEATGLGVDADQPLLDRARSNARDRDIETRVTFRSDLPTPDVDAADVVICVGADHIYGSQHAALTSLHQLVNNGGVLLFGTGYWETMPSVEQAASIGATPDELQLLADLVDLATSVGFRLLDLRTATRREWEQFELGYLADWEDWLMDWSHDPDAAEIRARTDDHRTGYLRGWRDVLGFAYLVLGRPTAQ